MSNLKQNQFPSIFNDFFDEKWFNTPITRDFEKLFPAVNIKKAENNYHLELVAPGMKKEDFHVNFENGLLVISAEHKEEKNEKQEEYTRREFVQSSFKRSFQLPEGTEPDKINAKYQDGLLKIDIPVKALSNNGSQKKINVQ